MTLVLLLSAVVVAVLLWALVAQRRRIDVLRARLADDPLVERARVEVIAIEIRNHVDLASARTGLARPLSRVTPGLIRSLVHKETIKLLRVELADQGVDADVRLRRIPVRREIELEDDIVDAAT